MVCSEVEERVWSLVISISSVGEGGGRRLAATWARRVFPLPGGPVRRMLCRPATAILRARFAMVCPRI